MMELVSVIIPTYGDGEYLRRCVDSVLAQTYRNIEIIVVDDNGLGTENQIKTASQMDIYKDNPQIKYICHEINRNGSAARNTGVKSSKGEFIALLDDDDEFYPDNIENHMRVLPSLGEEYALTYCGLRSYVGDKIDYERHPSKSGNLLYEVLLHDVVIGSSTLLIKRSVWDRIEGFDESFRRHQDWEFTARVCADYKVQAIDYIGVKRNIIMRNSPKNVDLALEYRKHYLERMTPYIERFSTERQNRIVQVNLLDICVQYLKSKQWKEFARLFFSLNPGVFGISFLIRRFFSAYKRGKLSMTK